jgi:hypothetical protein
VLNPKELLPDDARAVLAFIIDHPGQNITEIAKRLGFDGERTSLAVKELKIRNLVVGRDKPTWIHTPVEGQVLRQAYYPA